MAAFRRPPTRVHWGGSAANADPTPKLVPSDPLETPRPADGQLNKAAH